MQVGDRILSINGIRTEFMTSEEFHRVVYESGTSLRMEIEFDVTGKPFHFVSLFHLLRQNQSIL